MAEAAPNGDINTASPGHSESYRKGQSSKEKVWKETAVEVTPETPKDLLEGGARS